MNQISKPDAWNVSDRIGLGGFAEMIPLKLSVKNFLCYRDNVPTLDLEGVKVACLCGENGHGKSALLDAIAWALWGKARGIPSPSRSQDELIHHSENEALVELEFMARGGRYRVIRRHVRGQRNRSGSSDLQLLVNTGDDGFRPITGDSIRQTQRSIEELVGLDYETFINSAFLLQGRADEFTNKTANERKEILAKVMGLDAYDRLVERARARASDRQAELQATETRLEGLAREVEAREECRSSLREVQASLSQVQNRLREVREERDSLRRRVEELQALKADAQASRERIPALEQERKELLEEVKRHQERVQTYEALLSDAAAIESGFQELQRVQQRVEELTEAQMRHSTLLREREVVSGRIREQEARLSEEARQLEGRIAEELSPRAASVPDLEKEIHHTRSRLEELMGEEEALGREREQLQELSAKAGHLKAELTRLEAEGRELRTRVDLLERTPEGARCPLCNSALGESEFQHLLESHRTEIEEKRRLYQEGQRQLKTLEREQVALGKELERRERGLRRSQRQAHSRLSALETQLEEARRAAQELLRSRNRLRELQTQVAEGGFALEERAQLASLEREIASLEYDPGQLEEARRSAAGLRPFEERYRRLQETETRLAEERRSLANASRRALRLEEEIAALEERVRHVEKAVSELPQREVDLQRADGTVRELEEEERGLLGKEAVFKERLRRIAQYEQEMHALRRKGCALSEEVSAYQELAQAFGRRGIQALLIDSVLPELEREANQLLGRMTENRMHLKLESQRPLRSRKGEPVETLEVKISDELGTRNYEMYSGGEAFRVNLALRIALSRVLAQRRGAALPTLFIDEGFGTQDAAGRERIIEVIGAIEPLFQKILVVTHLEEVKEAFPVRIEVRKTERGSTFTVS